MLKVEFIGNLGADAEIKEANGSKWVSMRAAHTTKYQTENGEDRSITTWVDINLSNSESKVIPFLKAGVKVFVRGNADLRVYSSKKDRMMKAGLTIHASEIELVGGSTDAVPRQLIVPESGQIVDVNKYYQAVIDTNGWKKDDKGYLVDTKGNQYQLIKGGWVAPVQPEGQPQEGTDAKTK